MFFVVVDETSYFTFHLSHFTSYDLRSHFRFFYSYNPKSDSKETRTQQAWPPHSTKNRYERRTTQSETTRARPTGPSSSTRATASSCPPLASTMPNSWASFVVCTYITHSIQQHTHPSTSFFANLRTNRGRAIVRLCSRVHGRRVESPRQVRVHHMVGSLGERAEASQGLHRQVAGQRSHFGEWSKNKEHLANPKIK